MAIFFAAGLALACLAHPAAAAASVAQRVAALNDANPFATFKASAVGQVRLRCPRHARPRSLGGTSAMGGLREDGLWWQSLFF